MIALPSAVWWGNDTPTPVPTPDIGGEAGDFVEYIMENTDLKAWDVWFFGNSDSFGGTWGVKPSDLLPQLMGGQGSSNDAVSLVWGLITGMLSGVVGVFLMYIGLAVIKSLINGMRPKGTLPQTASSVIRVFAGLTALAAVWGAVTSCKECLLGLGKLSGVLAPVLLGLLTLFGMGSSAIAQQAAMTLYGSTVIGCLSKLVLPLAAAGGIMGALGAFGKELHTDGFGKLCHKACKWIIALISAAYFIMTAVRGISGGAADSVLLRTTKLAAGGAAICGRTGLGLLGDGVRLYEIGEERRWVCRRAAGFGVCRKACDTAAAAWAGPEDGGRAVSTTWGGRAVSGIRSDSRYAFGHPVDISGRGRPALRVCGGNSPAVIGELWIKL